MYLLTTIYVGIWIIFHLYRMSSKKVGYNKNIFIYFHVQYEKWFCRINTEDWVSIEEVKNGWVLKFMVRFVVYCIVVKGMNLYLHIHFLILNGYCG